MVESKVCDCRKEYPNGLQAARTSWKLYSLAEQTGSNDLLKYTRKVVLQVRPDQCQREMDSDIDPRWRWLGLTCEINKYS